MELVLHDKEWKTCEDNRERNTLLLLRFLMQKPIWKLKFQLKLRLNSKQYKQVTKSAKDCSFKQLVLQRISN